MRRAAFGVGLALFAGVLAGCGDGGSVRTWVQNESVAIRVQNSSAVQYDSVLVDFPEQREFYGTIQSGESSEYRVVGMAYSYAYVELQFSGMRGVLQPVDFVGEETLEPGRYTYRLTVNPNSESEHGRLGLELVADR